MDQVTQQNAAMVEQTTAATHSLKSQTGELVRQVETFRTSGGRRPSAAPSPAPAQLAQSPRLPRPQVRPGGPPISRGATAVAVKEEWEEF
jgi:methyl-accepting chemotaxis protein